MVHPKESEIDDLQYIMIWGVTLDSDKRFLTAELACVIDMANLRNGGNFKTVEFVPSDLDQLKAMDWREFKADSKDNSVVSYLYCSNPDRPVCTNEQRR